MIKEFSDLPAEEQNALLDAIPKITVMIAGADGSVSETEINWAEKVAHMRSYSNEPQLQSYYEAIDQDMDAKISDIIKNSSRDPYVMVDAIAEDLKGLNDILPKLEYNFRLALYRSFLSFAKQVAQADGGLLGFLAIHGEEADLIELPMLNPVI